MPDTDTLQPGLRDQNPLLAALKAPAVKCPMAPWTLVPENRIGGTATGMVAIPERGQKSPEQTVDPRH